MPAITRSQTLKIKQQTVDSYEPHECGVFGGIIRGMEGCGELFDMYDTNMLGNTSFCIPCYEKYEEKYYEEEKEEESDEEEYEYYNYGTQEDGSFMVAGGGMMNGNAYATVEKRNDKYYYCEFGKCPFNIYIGDIIDWSEERRDGCGGFNINSSPSTVCKHSRVDGFPHDVGDCDCGGYIEECPNCLDKVKCSHCGLCGGCGGGKMFSDSDSSDSDEEEDIERRNVCPEFDTDNLDTALYQDNCDWSFEKPSNKPYHTIYIFDKEEEDDY